MFVDTFTPWKKFSRFLRVGKHRYVGSEHFHASEIFEVLLVFANTITLRLRTLPLLGNIPGFLVFLNTIMWATNTFEPLKLFIHITHTFVFICFFSFDFADADHPC